LQRLDTASPVDALEAQITLAEESLWQLHELLQEGDTERLRATLRGLVQKVELRWEHYQTAKTMRSVLVGGTIFYRPSEVSFDGPAETRSEQAVPFTATDLDADCNS